MSHLEGFERKYLEVLEISWTELQRKKEEERIRLELQRKKEEERIRLELQRKKEEERIRLELQKKKEEEERIRLELQRKKEEEKRLKKLYDKVTPQLIKHIKLWANKTIMQPAYVKFLSKCHGK